MPIGTVKWFSNVKGYGFLNASEVDEDIFVHYSAIEMDGYKKLKSGQTVEFELTDGPRGLQAVNIRPREETPDP
jgi:CspA family cold shock protein